MLVFSGVAMKRAPRAAASRTKADVARGKYDDATKTLIDGQKNFPSSIVLEFDGWRLHRSSGRDKEAAVALSRLESMILAAPQRYTAAESRLTVGRLLLLRGAPARKKRGRKWPVVLGVLVLIAAAGVAFALLHHKPSPGHPTNPPTSPPSSHPATSAPPVALGPAATVVLDDLVVPDMQKVLRRWLDVHPDFGSELLPLEKQAAVLRRR